MNFIIKILISTLAVLVTDWLLDGVTIANGSFTTALIVALVLAFLNAIVKPALVILTIPITVFTLGIFLLVVNVIIVYLADKLVDGFSVKSFWSALWFSIVLSIITGVFERMKGNDVRRNNNRQNF